MRFLNFLLLSTALLSNSLTTSNTLAQERISPKADVARFSGLSFTIFPYVRVSKSTPGRSVRIGDLEVATKVNTLSKPALVSTELCGDADRSKIPQVDDSFILRLKSFVSYSFAQNTFAYEANYEFFDKESGQEIGATTSAFYVDETGTRKFKILCLREFKLESVPEWVTKLSK
jgi:hypothetical protein